MKDSIKLKLSDIAVISYGYTAKASVENVGSKFLRITDIQNDTVNWSSVPYCQINENDFEKYKLIDKDIVFARTGATTGKSYLVCEPPKAIAASYLIRLRLKDPTIDAKFISKYFQTQEYWDNISSGISGSAQGGFNASKLSELVIPLPPLSEQKRIVAILDEAFEGIDRAIRNTEKNLSNARELFESYLNSIFSQKGEGWEEKKLEDICEKVEYGSSAKSLAEGEIAVLRMGNIQNGAIDWSNLVYTNDQEEINKYLLKYNDVLFNRTNSDEHVGKTAIYKGEMPAIFAGYLIKIHRKEELIDADFLNFYLNSPIAREYGKSIMSRSVNQANINGTKLKGYPISIPSLSIQKQIVKKLSFLRTETQRLENIYRQKIAALKELKQSILQKAFTGELTADKGEPAKEEIAA